MKFGVLPRKAFSGGPEGQVEPSDGDEGRVVQLDEAVVVDRKWHRRNFARLPDRSVEPFKVLKKCLLPFLTNSMLKLLAHFKLVKKAVKI